MTRLWLGLLLVASPVASAEPSHVGDVYRITRISESSEKDSNGSTSSTYDRDILTERVIAERETGVELEYDAVGIPAQQRKIAWQYPFRIFKPFVGPPQLLNAAELRARNDRWLAAAKLPLAACGSWYFTWNAFQVQCDPQVVLTIVETFDLGPPSLVDGAPFRSPSALAAAPLVRKDSMTFAVDLLIDPEKVRAARVENDLVVAQVTRQPLAREDAVRAHAVETITGTISITFRTIIAGQIFSRSTLSKVSITLPGGRSITQSFTETIGRRLVTAGR